MKSTVARVRVEVSRLILNMIIPNSLTLRDGAGSCQKAGDWPKIQRGARVQASAVESYAARLSAG